MKKFLKIVLIVVVVIGVIVGIAMWATSGIADVAKNQISLLSEGKTSEAYEKYSSKAFKLATSPELFKNFVESHKELSENKEVTFSSRTANTDGTGTLEGTLTGKDGSKTTVKYSLVKEDNEWKIMNIEFPQAGITTKGDDTKAAVTSVIDVIAMSDSAGQNGVVAKSDSKTTFKTTTKEIFVSVYLNGAAANDEVTAGIMHLSTQSIVGPVSNSTGKGGDQTSQFSFTMPTKGWPTGDYSFKVMLGNGEAKELPFKVE